MKIADVIFREDLYPRFKPNQEYISIYSQAVDNLPPIKVSQNGILIDGFHRLKAHSLAGKTEIQVEVISVDSEKELKQLAYKYNSTHGLQLTQEEKKSFANEMIGDGLDVKELAQILSVSIECITKWTKAKRASLEEQRDRLVVEEYLRAWNTQEGIAKQLNISQKTVSNVLSKNGKFTEITKAFKPYIYNIWNLQKQDNSMADRFGSFPNVFMQNLLHLHTQPLDVVYDPFTGGGTTIDVCQAMFRRYYCTDKTVTPGREKDMRQRDISQGPPGDLPKPDLMFLDPPYLELAKTEYSTDQADLGNMEAKEFYNTLNTFIANIIKCKKPKRIAYLIRPVWHTNNGVWSWDDPLFSLYDLIENQYRIEARYVLPYSTEQYSALWVDRAKKQNKCLILNRELTIFEEVS